jgi:hypothetical protein
MNSMPLAPGYEFGIYDAGDGLDITLREKATQKEFAFYLAGDNISVRIGRLASHMASMTEDQCKDQWFREVLTAEERKAKQKADKEAKREAARLAREVEEATALLAQQAQGAQPQ